MRQYYYCDNCKTWSNTETCQNCFMPARLLDPGHDCIECGQPFEECTCAKEVTCDVVDEDYPETCQNCGGHNVNNFDGYLQCEDCGFIATTGDRAYNVNGHAILCPHCGSPNVTEDGYNSCMYCHDCGQYFDPTTEENDNGGNEV